LRDLAYYDYHCNDTKKGIFVVNNTKVVKKRGTKHEPYLGRDRARALFNEAYERAMQGDVQAQSLIFKYIFPPLKAVTCYQLNVDMSTPAAQVRSILDASYAGTIDAESAQIYINNVTRYAQILETTEIMDKLDLIETKLNKGM
jgi:hypothetical protein